VNSVGHQQGLARQDRHAAIDELLAKTTLVIPACNEESAIGRVLDELPRGLGQILVVDGVSTDQTRGVAQNVDRQRVEVVSRTRRGKGNALACGLGMAEGEFVILMDGDGSAAPVDLGAMVSRLASEDLDFVKGHREPAGGISIRDHVRKFGTGLLTSYFNASFDSTFKDVCCGFVALRRDVIPEFGLNWMEREDRVRWHDGFEIDALLVGRALITGLKIAEQPVSYLPRLGGRTKTRAIRDTGRITRVINETANVGGGGGSRIAATVVPPPIRGCTAR
jgi:glycosyltransferase involved in cell wall biosynthesis